MTDSPVLQRVRELIEPIASDLDLDLYDLEQRGGTLRVTIDTPPGSEGGVDMDKLAASIETLKLSMGLKGNVTAADVFDAQYLPPKEERMLP